MKQIFLEAKYKGKIKINQKDIAKLPKTLGLVTTVQFIDRINEVKKIIKREFVLGKGKT